MRGVSSAIPSSGMLNTACVFDAASVIPSPSGLPSAVGMVGKKIPKDSSQFFTLSASPLSHAPIEPRGSMKMMNAQVRNPSKSLFKFCFAAGLAGFEL